MPEPSLQDVVQTCCMRTDALRSHNCRLSRDANRIQGPGLLRQPLQCIVTVPYLVDEIDV